MKRFPLLILALVVFAVTAQAQRSEQVMYRDSLVASGNTATATSSAAGYEVFKAFRDDFEDYQSISVSLTFTKKTDSAKIQCAVRTFGEDTTWQDVYVRKLIDSPVPAAPGWSQQRDTLITWITDVGFDEGYDHGPYLIDQKYIGRAWRIVSGTLDTGDIYFMTGYKTPF